jgi:hypothetical protein
MCKFFLSEKTKSEEKNVLKKSQDEIRPAGNNVLRNAAHVPAKKRAQGLSLRALLNLYAVKFNGGKGENVQMICRGGFWQEEMFEVKIGRVGWRVSITADEDILKGKDYFFGFRDVYIRKGLKVSKRNEIILQMCFAAVLEESGFVCEIKRIFEEKKFLEFCGVCGKLLGGLIMSGQPATSLKTQARKERYLEKIRSGYTPDKQAILKMAA